MGATLEQLYRDMEALRKRAAEVGSELRQVLTEYLNVLVRSVSKQLVLSSFHLCTQLYPEAFLSLTVSEREVLQKNIQSLSQQVTSALSELQSPLQTQDFGSEVNPTVLLELWETLETGMVDVLRDATRQVNQLLLESRIMKIKSLDKLLNTAAQAQEAGRTITNPPNLLKAFVDPKDFSEDSLEPVVVIYLQVGDLEFTDAELMSWRQKLRPLRQKLDQIQQTYVQKQEEQLTAEATAAWRATWTDQELIGG